MNLFNILAIMDGTQRNFGEGAIVCLTAILIVFSVLLIIIGASSLISLIINKFSKKENKVATVTNNPSESKSLSINVEDEDMMAAILVATIDYRNEIKKDVKVISVREVK
jgi:Na+-transporting methylmalonyl-CoA/oxaloacetate decarboxylase gamma subunit